MAMNRLLVGRRMLDSYQVDNDVYPVFLQRIIEFSTLIVNAYNTGVNFSTIQFVGHFFSGHRDMNLRLLNQAKPIFFHKLIYIECPNSIDFLIEYEGKYSDKALLWKLSWK